MASRRTFLGMLPGGLGLSGLAGRGGRAWAQEAPQHLLVVFARGGWDLLKFAAPVFDNPDVVFSPGDLPGSANGIDFVDSAERPAVRAFLEAHGDRCCLLNGIEVRSVTHERCRRLLMTGRGEAGADDWAAIVAGSTRTATTALPYLVVSGAGYGGTYASQIVRVGDDGQLAELLDPDALYDGSDRSVPVLPASARAAVDAAVRERAQPGTGAGRDAQIHTAYAEALAQHEALRSLDVPLDLSTTPAGCRRDTDADAALAIDAFSRGLCRTALVEDRGWCGVSWDSHDGIFRQDWHYEELFGYLGRIVDRLDSTTGPDGRLLSASTVVAVVSEMGRHPAINVSGGRDHWTFTSALLFGAGVRGGQVIGDFTAGFAGERVDLGTGRVSDSGERLRPEHLGATLLSLCGVDSTPWVGGGAPIRAAVEGL